MSEQALIDLKGVTSNCVSPQNGGTGCAAPYITFVLLQALIANPRVEGKEAG